MMSIVRLAAVLGGVYAGIARPRVLRWGTRSGKVVADLPGDDLVASADVEATRAITIHASADEVWPWLAQMGQGRGGLYSYDALENLVGCDMRSAGRIVADWQRVAVGDPFRLHPDVALEVARVEPGRVLVVRGSVPLGRQTTPPYDFTWAFVLDDQADGTTRLIVRERYRYTRRWAPLLVEPVQMVSFFMTVKMLRGIRDRAEGRLEMPVASTG